MPKIQEQYPIPEQLVVANPTNLQIKLADFAIGGATDLHLVLDFDRTLTIRKPGSRDEVTTWHILQEHLPVDAKRAYQDEFTKYRALELEGRMTQEDAINWWTSILNLFVENKIDLNAVEEDFLSKASIRDGVPELMKLCQQNNIPTIILSAGVRDIIEIWCRKYGIQPTLVISTALITDSNNRIAGWKEDTLVHTLNKSEASHPELISIRSARPNALLVGDGVDDAAMADGEDNVVRLRLLDPRDDEETTEPVFGRFDGLITSGNFKPIEELLQTII
ncbi:MAG: HAD-IB family phosphatase [Candidatus Saccharimonadales bacterium]